MIQKQSVMFYFRCTIKGYKSNISTLGTIKFFTLSISKQIGIKVLQTDYEYN